VEGGAMVEKIAVLARVRRDMLFDLEAGLGS
jgi:hypothetical protein